jgi:hypothetical protein
MREVFGLPFFIVGTDFAGMAEIRAPSVSACPESYARPFAAFTPARVRSLIRLRSSSASADHLPHGAAGRRLSVDGVREGTEFRTSWLKSSSIRIRSRKLRPRRSSFHTMSVSPGSSFFRQRCKAGRLVVAPDKPSSLKMVLQPAFFSAASCRAGVVVRRDAGITVFHFMPSILHRHLQHRKTICLRAFRR